MKRNLSHKKMYFGMRSQRLKMRHKYAGCEFTVLYGMRVRQLTESEIAEFRSAVQRTIDARVRTL